MFGALALNAGTDEEIDANPSAKWLGVTTIWMIAAATIAAKRALDYRSTTRAALVCAGAWLLSFG